MKAKPPPRSLKALFVGNSFTARNDLPGLVARLAEADGRRLESELIQRGGASLKMHWNKGEAARAIAAGGHDVVVLQEQSTLPIKNAARFRENVLLFDPAIRAAGARTVLYMTWARKHAPETQAALTDAYRAVGEEIGATVIPAGVAWTRCLATPGGPVLHDKDGSHPTLAGSYLTACVAYATLFGRSPVGNAAVVEGLTPDEMKILQTTAVR